ncbi:MAG: penicillin-binding protein 2 [Armatimonadota bacterium]|nr:penicillin-binding protein 2 [Armatimonadota bacterium]
MLVITPQDRKLQRARAQRFAICIWVVFIVLFARLWQLQIAQGDALLRQSETNRRRLLRVRAPRGVILDRKNRTVATSRPRFVVSVIPERIQESPEALARLCDILQTSREDLRAIINRNQSIKGAPVRVEANATPETVAMIEEQKFLLPGVSVELDQVRYYPDGSLFAHVLGYLREIDKDELEQRKDMYRPGDFIGKSGIERQYDGKLHGTDGGKLIEVDAHGRRTRLLGDQDSMPGATLVLSLDKKVQKAAADALDGKVGAAVALNPRTGEVLAMVSKPDFDPNVFVKGLKSSDWAGITGNKHHPLQNRCISNKYPPGSTFKVVTAAAGLTHGVITTHSSANCPGIFYLGRHPWRCWSRHGGVNFYTAISRSCDVFFYRTGLRLGMDHLSDMALAFGLGNKTGVDLPNERSGCIPTREWKKRVNPRDPDWHAYESINSAIGQGDVETTPLQMALVAAVIANNGKAMRPHMLKEIRDRTGKVIATFKPGLLRKAPVSQEDIASIKKGMRETVIGARGTGHVVNLPGITVAAKTGSAQHHRGRRTHAWFICFAPVENPQIAICVFREEGGHGGSESGPVARAMLEEYFHVRAQAQRSGRTD